MTQLQHLASTGIIKPQEFKRLSDLATSLNTHKNNLEKSLDWERGDLLSNVLINGAKQRQDSLDQQELSLDKADGKNKNLLSNLPLSVSELKSLNRIKPIG